VLAACLLARASHVLYLQHSFESNRANSIIPFLDAAYSDVAVLRVHIVFMNFGVSIPLMAQHTQQKRTDDESKKRWHALFPSGTGALPLAVGPMLDFLFKPSPSFIAQVLQPMLQRMPAWLSSGPRVGVHFRTLEADGKCVLCRRVVFARF
jgi:hypothetical protein